IEMTEEILAAKKNTGLSWEEIAEKISLGPVFLTSACLGMNSLKKAPAEKLCDLLGLSAEVSQTLQ
ncbi:MAG TPA: cyanate hydratase, partial [Sulfuricurvum sp.]|nr:cyanate hydratase [Sulfuricurvum sp.]